MHDSLFTDIRSLGPDIFKKNAERLGLDTSAFDSCLGSDLVAKVWKDQQFAASLGVAGTPTIMLGRLDGEQLTVTARVYGAQPVERVRDAIRDGSEGRLSIGTLTRCVVGVEEVDMSGVAAKRRHVLDLLISFVVVLTCVVAAVPAGAQTPVERAALEREVQRGRRIYVEVQQQVVVGSARALSVDTIDVAGDAGPRQLRLSDVDRIYRDGDSVWNGFAIGAAVLGTWCAVICGQGLNSGGEVVLATLNAAVVGGGIGALFDWSHRGTTTLYRRRATPVRVVGVATPRAIGLGVQMAWR